jgi:hypothetical protein
MEEMPAMVVGGAATRLENAHWRQYYFLDETAQ